LQGAGEPDYQFTAEELASPKLPEPEPDAVPAILVPATLVRKLKTLSLNMLH